MNEGAKTIIFPVRDLPKAKAVFTALLGSGPAHDQPYYVGYNVGGQDVGLDPNGHKSGMTGPTVYWHVDDLDGTLKALVDAGAEINQEVREVGAGRRIASVKDPDGNVIGVLQDA